jgi:Flp pilus assembly protein TadD
MSKQNIKWLKFLLSGLLAATLVMGMSNAPATTYLIQTGYTSAVESLLNESKNYYDAGQFEQAAALLERALRIDPRNPILWHNLSGIRLIQQDWKRAANLAQKSNTLAGNDKQFTDLRIRNWVVITQACEAMENISCAREARNRAQALLQKN